MLVVFLNVIFSNNIVEGFGGDIYIKDYSLVNLIFNNSWFECNLSYYFVLVFVYFDVNLKFFVNIINCCFKLYFEVDVSVILFLRFGISFYIDKKFDIMCLLGYFFENVFNVSFLGLIIEDIYKFICKRCFVGLYNF